MSDLTRPRVFTPLSADRSERYVWPAVECTFFDQPDLDLPTPNRYLGKVLHDGVTYDVFGEPCGLGCYCDARVVEVADAEG